MMHVRTWIIRGCGTFLTALVVSCGSPVPAASLDPKPAPPPIVNVPAANEARATRSIISTTPPPGTSASSATPLGLVRKRLRFISVQSRLPDLIEKPHADPRAVAGLTIMVQHVEEAIGRADADMFVTFERRTPKRSEWWRTDPGLVGTLATFDAGHFGGYPDGNVAMGGLSRYGVQTWFCYSPSSAPYVLSPVAQEEALVDQTPVLIWAISPHDDQRARVYFVTLRGDTYRMTIRADGPTFGRAKPPSAWPLYAGNRIVGRGGLPLRALNAVDAAFSKCADKAWTRAQRRLTQVQRDSEEHVPTGALVRTACARQILDWENTVATHFRARDDKRTALYDKAVARAALLGL